MIIDFDRCGPEEIQTAIENAHYPNRCINPSVKSIVEKDIGPWSDDNPLNSHVTCDAEYKRLFGK